MAVQLTFLKVSTNVHLRQWMVKGPFVSWIQSWLLVGPVGLIWMYSSFPAVAVGWLICLPVSWVAVIFYLKMQALSDMQQTRFWVIKGLLAFVSSLPALYI